MEAPPPTEWTPVYEIPDQEDDPPEAYAGLVGQVRDAVDLLKKDPSARKAIHELKFASMTIRRTGVDLCEQMEQAIGTKAEDDWRMRGWLRQAVKYAHELLDEG